MAVCGRCEVRAAGYRGVAGSAALCARCFVRQSAVLRRSLLTALVVGSALTAINQGNVLLAALAGELPVSLLWKVPLTYLVPLVVSTWGALGASRIRC